MMVALIHTMTYIDYESDHNDRFVGSYFWLNFLNVFYTMNIFAREALAMVNQVELIAVFKHSCVSQM